MGNKMLAVKVHEMKFECPLCGKEYSHKQAAEECLNIHNEAITKLISGYKPGARMLAHDSCSNSDSKIPVIILKTEGELVNFSVFVEHEDGSRWWRRNIVQYARGESISYSIEKNPTNFWVNEPLI